MYEGKLINTLFSEEDDSDDPEYLAILRNPKYEKARELIDKKWALFRKYSDSKFPAHFRKHFHSRLWELWLGTYFLNQKYLLEEKGNTDWPDFIIKTKEQEIIVEAISPDNATEESGNAVPELNPYYFQPIQSDLIEMRIRHAIIEKYQKRHTEQIEQREVPYIIAINVSKIPYARFNFGDIPWIIKALYPIGPEIAIIDENQIFEIRRAKTYSNKKKSGSIQSKEIFSSEGYSLISGIIYSDIPIDLKEEKNADSLVLIKNPNAKYLLLGSLGLKELEVEYDGLKIGYRRV